MQLLTLIPATISETVLSNENGLSSLKLSAGVSLHKKERIMNTHSKKSILVLVCLTACLTLVSLPSAVRAQSSGTALSVRVNPTIASAGTTVGVFGVITNTTSSKMRTTVTLTAVSPCGIETNLGSTRLALNSGQSMQITVSYPLAPDACLGMYTINMTANAGKNSAGNTTSTYLTVQ